MSMPLGTPKVSMTVSTGLGCLTSLAIFIPTSANALTIIDSINADKSLNPVIWAATEVGWSYTPTSSYDLGGIFTKFGSSDARNVTVEVYDSAPSLGGILLRSVDFNPLSNAFSGGTFLPLNLVAGEDYFVGFRNVGGLSTNVTEDIGAIALDPVRFSFNNDGSYSLVESGSPSQPILQFASEAPAIPTPALLPGIIGMVLAAWRKRKAESPVEVSEEA